ncbi:hypothetical protein BLNAU_7810 [Blattamonas nauphoetae]|uniref:Uncharacterized protein n=1 Tax=Blattamonas nauphoetae TaxID=2049346 RepID=A0ABQ9Y0G6_9EUKA|nr:hypothetical protein BLNAU_7810 [Blattamonas nauphoetae]
MEKLKGYDPENGERDEQLDEDRKRLDEMFHRLHDQKALLDCAKVAFGKAFTPFENEWNSVELNSQTPISIEELRKEASDCVLNCAIRNDYSTFQKCLPRCERIMEGAAEVEKRKAISNLNAYQPSFMSAASSDPFASVAQEMSFLTPLSSKTKKNERMELAEKNARVLLNRRAHPHQ